MFDKLATVESRYDDLMTRLGTTEVQSDAAEYKKAAKSLSELEPLVQKYREYKAVDQDIAGSEELARGSDAEMRALAEDELKSLYVKRDALLEEIKILLIPKDPNDEKNVILEIRAGTGGEEAALFASELFNMYQRYGQRQGWKFDVMSVSHGDAGGLKEAIASIEGRGVYSHLKYESGVHRVQRVPVTEGSGRIHTSAATVAVLPEAEDVDIDVQEKDLRIDVYRASGAGGQHVNKTESAVRITHLPTGVAVAMQEEKSQHKNRAKAMKILKARLYEAERERQANERAAERRGLVGSGDRSERIRTYNFPQGRVTDHRINLTLYKLDRIISGDDLGDIIDALVTEDQASRLAAEDAE